MGRTSHLHLDLVHEQLLSSLSEQRLLTLPPTPTGNLRALLEAGGGSVKNKHGADPMKQQPGLAGREGHQGIRLGC